jgi:class 3 adenylate cyclase
MRLVLALFPLLAAVVWSTLWLAERSFSRAQIEALESQFTSFLEIFEEARAARFEGIRDWLEGVAASPQVVTALKTGDGGALRQLMEEKMRSLSAQRLAPDLAAALGFGLLSDSGVAGGPARLGAGPGAAPPPGAPGGRVQPATPRTRPGLDGADTPSPRSAAAADRSSTAPPRPSPLYYAFLDEEGRLVHEVVPVLPPGFTRSRENARLAREEREQKTRAMLNGTGRPFAELMRERQVGYLLTRSGPDNSPRVLEVFVTPVRSEGGDLEGALVFGLPLTSAGERQLYLQSGHSDYGRIMSGVMVDGEIVSETIPQEKRPMLVALLNRALGSAAPAHDDLIATMGGVRHRVIYSVLNSNSMFQPAVRVNLYSLVSIDREIRQLRVAAAEIGLGAVLLSLGLIFWLSRRLSQPVSALTEATREIAAGHLEHRVPVSSRDELGELGRAFNEMASTLARQSKFRAVLDAVADPAVAERLLADSTGSAGELREVSMLFCDIRGFTALSERLDPAMIVDMLNHHITALTELAHDHGGTVDKFVGDMIMVLFGAPESVGEDALRAARCAAAMQRARQAMNQGAEVPLEIGIGIASGPVIAGCMGSDRRLSYTVIGPRVNLAARLCSDAGPGEVLVCDTTGSQAAAEFPLIERPPARLKGFSGPVASFELDWKNSGHQS